MQIFTVIVFLRLRIITRRGSPLEIRVDNGPEYISGQLLQ